MGQHLPGRRGRRRLAPLLVLVQVARLDPHPRQAGRAAEVPRGDRRRVRAASAPAPRRRGGVGDVGRRPPRVDRHASTTAPPTSATCSSAASGSSTSRATPTGPASTTSPARSSTRRAGSTSTTSPTRSSRSWARARPPRRSSPPSSPTCSSVYLFQREPGWVMPKGDRDFTPEERKRFSNRLRRRQERLRLKWLLEKNIWGGKVFVVDTKENDGPHAVLPRLHRQELRGPSRPAEGGHADATRTRASGRSSPRRSIPRSRNPTSSSSPRRWRR